MTRMGSGATLTIHVVMEFIGRNDSLEILMRSQGIGDTSVKPPAHNVLLKTRDLARRADLGILDDLYSIFLGCLSPNSHSALSD